MKKAIIVGDPHVTVPNLKESEVLLNFIKDQANKTKSDTIIFMGDQFHNHSIVRIEVQQFWKKWFEELAKDYKVIALVGNHDMRMVLGQKENENAMDVYKHIITVVDKPTTIDGVGFCPYIIDHENFKSHVDVITSNTLFAHQTFLGAVYDNGFYATDSVDIRELSFSEIISGHIHKRQSIGICHYVGTPRWEGADDANEDKGLWLFSFDNDVIVDKEFISAESVIPKVVKIEINEKDEVDLKKIKTDGVKLHIEVTGSPEYISKVRKKFKGKASIKGVYVKGSKKGVVREAGFDIYKYIQQSFEPNGVSKQEIESYIRERELV